MKKLFNKSKKGFTIVELVIVIGVIGILSAILIPTFVNLNSRATEAALKSDLAAVYSSYVADVADGYYGETQSETQKADKIYGQTEVALVKKGDEGKTEAVFYVYSTNNTGWDVSAKTKSDAKADTNALTSVEYGGYLVFKRVLNS